MSVGGLIVAGFGVLIGIMLWAFGRRILRPGFVLVGAILGAASGYVLAVGLDLPVPDWAPALIGAALLGLFAWIAYRPAMGVFLAVLLGVACPLGVIGWAEYRGAIDIRAAAASDDDPRADERATPEEILGDLRDGFDLLRETDNALEDLRRDIEERLRQRRIDDSPSDDLDADDLDAGETGTDAAESNAGYVPAAWIEKYSEVVAHLRGEFLRQWEAAPPGVRRSIVLSAACGAIFGLLLGLSLPAIGAAVATAAAGAALALFSAWALVSGLGLGEGPWIPGSTGAWIITWGALTAAGMAIQWTFRPRTADSSSR